MYEPSCLGSLPKSVRPFYEHLLQTLGPQDVQAILEEFRSDWTGEPITEAGWKIDGSQRTPNDWLKAYFPHVATAPLAPHHFKFWDWIESLKPGISPPSFVACWPRGGGKSTTVELGITYVGSRLSRRFALIVSETQSQADERVKSVAEHFTSLNVKNATNAQGYSLGWRADQLRTENGFNVVGIGLDKATRGVKLGTYRPDWIIFDDIDGRLDTPATIAKKKTTITESILKAGSNDLAATFVQNLIHSTSIMSEVVNGTADFLLDRNPVDVVKAIEGFRVEQMMSPDGTQMLWKIVEGVPVWGGQDLAVCEKDINRAGLKAFKRESLQDIEEASGGLWDGLPIRFVADGLAPGAEHPFPVPVKADGLPTFDQIVVAVDPSGSRRGDEAGIVAAGSFRLPGGKIGVVVLEDISEQMSPKMWAQESIALYRRLGAKRLLCERNFGGELVEDNLKDYPGAPPITMVSVTNGKIIRAEPVQQRYENGLVWHARNLPALQSQMNSWKPGSGLPSPGSLDAMVIAVSVLFGIADYVKIGTPAGTPAVSGTFGFGKPYGG